MTRRHPCGHLRCARCPSTEQTDIPGGIPKWDATRDARAAARRAGGARPQHSGAPQAAVCREPELSFLSNPNRPNPERNRSGPRSATSQAPAVCAAARRARACKRLAPASSARRSSACTNRAWKVRAVLRVWARARTAPARGESAPGGTGWTSKATSAGCLLKIVAATRSTSSGFRAGASLAPTAHARLGQPSRPRAGAPWRCGGVAAEPRTAR